MSVHPAPRKHPIAVQCCATVAVSAENLCRLPHVFDKVLELPLADAAVAIKEDAEEARFVAAAEGFSPGGARARAIEVHSGVTKVVVWDLSAGVGSDDGAAAFDLALRVGGPAPSSPPSFASIRPASSAGRSPPSFYVDEEEDRKTHGWATRLHDLVLNS